MIESPAIATVDPRAAKSLARDDGAKTSPRDRTYYYSHDGLGSVRTLTDSSGTLENTYDFLPFGNLLGSGTSGTVDQRYTYTGREDNPAASLMYYRRRSYDSSVGRFGARDTPSHGADYVYAQSNPTTMTDPFGLNGTLYVFAAGGVDVQGAFSAGGAASGDVVVITNTKTGAVCFGGPGGLGVAGGFGAGATVGLTGGWFYGPECAIDLEGQTRRGFESTVQAGWGPGGGVTVPPEVSADPGGGGGLGSPLAI